MLHRRVTATDIPMIRFELTCPISLLGRNPTHSHKRLYPALQMFVNILSRYCRGYLDKSAGRCYTLFSVCDATAHDRNQWDETMANGEEPLFTIGAVARMTGIAEDT